MLGMKMDIRESPIVAIYISAFRDFVNEAVQSSDASVRGILKFNKEEDWNFVTIAMDVFEDAHAAIGNFIRFGSSGPTKNSDIGERYLRLYGFLAATYNQQEAVRELHARMNVPNPKALKKEIDQLEIRTLRHKLASHSTNYMDGNEKKGAFAPTRIELQDYTISTYSYSNEEFLSFDLMAELKEHFNCMIRALDVLFEKSVKTVFKGKQKQLSAFGEKLNDLRFERDGGMIIQSQNDGQKFKIAFLPGDHDA